MKKVYLQHWEESERGWGIRPDGCSLHLTLEDRKKYIEKYCAQLIMNHITSKID